MAQAIELHGKVQSSVNVENIHVINATAQKFTITDKNGAFRIPVKLNDTVSFSSVQHEPKDIIITSEILSIKTISVRLKEKINTLDEVVVGKILTGDLSSDIGNVEEELPINFYDLGIPGYTGKIATQSERRLAQAGEFKPIMLLGLLGGSMPLDPIINGISGRTKMLKGHVQHEKNDTLLKRIRIELSETLFSLNPLEEEFRMDFFYFCEMDDNFYARCAGKTDLEVLEFLQEKLKTYKANQILKQN
ncbi:hypothetical protein [Hyunsoonleella rubra]|uniref:Carboxypeptidase-like regulatory domain-containing protein n=1 Tax=Hyunsoonleella rubra TaxID=1737062 RepID=A0ABW5T879_9FLAO